MSDSPDESFEYALSVAPDDVRATFEFLERNGFVLADGSGRGESMGGVVVTFARGAESIEITRDRHQWSMDLRRAEWRKNFDLDIILDTIEGRRDWSARIDGLPEQLPPGVSWVTVLPRVWTWLDATPDVEMVLADAQRRRGRSHFPPTSRRPT